MTTRRTAAPVVKQLVCTRPPLTLAVAGRASTRYDWTESPIVHSSALALSVPQNRRDGPVATAFTRQASRHSAASHGTCITQKNRIWVA
jgi:hypothetical protein